MERKVEDVARVLKEMEEDNLDLNKKFKVQNELLKAREKELEDLVDENDNLLKVVKTKKKSQQVQTDLALSDLSHSLSTMERIQGKVQGLEEENQELKSDLTGCRKKLKEVQTELERTN